MLSVGVNLGRVRGRSGVTMRVILEVASGAREGQKLLVQRGQWIEVGRTPLVDLDFEHDAQMSGTHFRIRVDEGTCHIEDLESTNGTFVNGQRIQRARLFGQDVITAGETRFVLQMEGSAPRREITKTVQAGSFPTVSATYVAQPCASGLHRYEGSVKQLPPSRLAQLLTKHFQPLLILHPNKVTDALRGQLDDVEYLFDWLPESARHQASPYLITSAELMARVALFDEAWGKDALIAVYSEPEAELPRESLRRAAGAFASPNVLRPQLTLADADFVRGVVAGIDVILVESESPESWLLYATEDLAPLLAANGLVRSEPTTAG